SAGRWPDNNFAAPCDTTLPAIFPASEPIRVMRESRELGIGRDFGVSFMSF
ncbi:MAG: hypothetical protein GY695_00020, partial [Aestuariibacter sp.]|nr:hypothetical protein [Aestuariibacter sp.]